MKYSLKGKLYGRNMLIGEYVWLHYVASLPPGVQPDEKQMRGRKQVSSHIQVLKNFLKEHPFCKSRCWLLFYDIVARLTRCVWLNI